MVLPELAAYLASQGLGTVDVDIFYGILPAEEPSAIIALYEYAGSREPDMGTGNIRLEMPMVQVLVRGEEDKYAAARLRIQNVLAALEKVGSVPGDAYNILSGVGYTAVECQLPRFIKRDDNFRPIFTMNCKVTKGFSAT